jgi:hypothetical protein
MAPNCEENKMPNYFVTDFQTDNENFANKHGFSGGYSNRCDCKTKKGTHQLCTGNDIPSDRSDRIIVIPTNLQNANTNFVLVQNFDV